VTLVEWLLGGISILDGGRRHNRVKRREGERGEEEGRGRKRKGGEKIKD
jgi:hypothetical protein